MNKYERIIESLNTTGTGQMKCFGNSMTPILQSGSTNSFVVEKEYRIGDIVFCKVKGRYIDAHKITKIDQDGRFMIANNHNFENGWTKTIYARLIKSEIEGTISDFSDDRQD